MKKHDWDTTTDEAVASMSGYEARWTCTRCGVAVHSVVLPINKSDCVKCVNFQGYEVTWQPLAAVEL